MVIRLSDHVDMVTIESTRIKKTLQEKELNSKLSLFAALIRQANTVIIAGLQLFNF